MMLPSVLLVLCLLLGLWDIVHGHNGFFCTSPDPATACALVISPSMPASKMGGCSASTANPIIVKRGTTALVSGSTYVPGETLTISPTSAAGYCMEVLGGTLAGGSCSNTRVCAGSGTAGGTWTLPASGAVTVNFVWTSGCTGSGLKVETPFTLTAGAPAPAPTPVPTFAPGTTAAPSFAPTPVPTATPTAAPTIQSNTFALDYSLTLQGISSADVESNEAALAQVIATKIGVLINQVAILSVGRRRRTLLEEQGAEDAAAQSLFTPGLRQVQQFGRQVLHALTARKLAGTAVVRFQIGGFASSAAASASQATASAWFIDASAAGFATALKNAVPSLTVTSTAVTSSTVQDTSLSASTASFQHSCALSAVDTMYWTVAPDSSYVTVFMLHKGAATTKLDWIAMGLVDPGNTKMVETASPNRVYLYRPNVVSSDYLHQIDGYSSGAVVPATNAARTSTHQGVTGVQSIDNYVTMQFEINKATGVSTDVQLNLGQGNNNKIIFASGAVWPNIHSVEGFSTVSWTDGVCKEVAKVSSFPNTIIWFLAALPFLFNAKFSPLRNMLNDNLHMFSSLKRLHPTILSRFIGNYAASWFMLDSNNAQTFTVPSVIIIALYLVVNVVVYVKLVPTGLQWATGKVAVMNMWIALIPTSKNSTVLYFFGVPFERSVKFHRLVTKVGFFFMCLHLFYAREQIISVTGTGDVFSFVEFGKDKVVPGHGAIAFACYTLMVASAFKIVRDSKYEVFLIFHYLWMVAVVFNMLHFKAGSKYQLGFIPGIVLHLVDKFYLVTAATYNAKLQSIAQSEEAGRWAVDVVSLKVPMKTNYSSFKYFGGWKWFTKIISSYDPRPYIYTDLEYDSFHGGLGQYYFVNVPSISMIEWHPFSVSDIVENESDANGAGGQIGFHIKAMGAGTFSLALAAKAQNGPVGIDVKLRGPYGSLSLNIFEYSHIVLIAGGIGITPMLPILDRIRHWITADKLKKCPKLLSVTVVWVARQDNKALFQYMADRIAEPPSPAGKSDLETASPVNGSKIIAPEVKNGRSTSIFSDSTDVPRIKWTTKFHLTGGKSKTPETSFTSFSKNSHECSNSRPNVKATLEAIKGKSDDKKLVCALMCGPAPMTADAATACADLGVDYHLETFGW